MTFRLPGGAYNTPMSGTGAGNNASGGGSYANGGSLADNACMVGVGAGQYAGWPGGGTWVNM